MSEEVILQPDKCYHCKKPVSGGACFCNESCQEAFWKNKPIPKHVNSTPQEVASRIQARCKQMKEESWKNKLKQQEEAIEKARCASKGIAYTEKGDPLAVFNGQVPTEEEINASRTKE